MKDYKKEFEELKKISINLASIARNQAIQKNSTADFYNDCIKKMFDLGCFPRESTFEEDILIDDHK